ncbi:MAG: uracil-DNA glycosylase family protein [Bacteroidales bacterium]|nr:uracil-DNA glycosylase family protein [Bacteroidales bacterium]
MTLECHPLEPFLPPEASILFLGSFPPPRARWSMDFFYPNFINDFWRVMGLLHFGDPRYFELAGQKRFDRARIVPFCEEHALAFYDTARRVRRLKDNASDAFLEILEPTDVGMLLARIPACRHIVTTGGKASGELQALLSAATGTDIVMPPVGGSVEMQAWGREFAWWRMPSTSRAYPLPLAQKAECYRKLFPEIPYSPTGSGT